MISPLSKQEKKLFKKVLDTGNSDLLVSVYRRSRFYLWFQFEAMKKKLKIRWPLAAYVASSTIQHLALNDTLLGNNKIERFVYSGNQIILDDVLPKLRLAINNNKLKKDEESLKWDTETLYEEQHLIHSLYKNLSHKDLSIIQDIAKGSNFLTKIGKLLTPLNNFDIPKESIPREFIKYLNLGIEKPAFNGSIIDIIDRCNFGFDIANKIFKTGSGSIYKSKSIFKKPKNINSEYKIKKIKGKYSSDALKKVLIKENIHVLRSLLNDNYLNLDEIENILKKIAKGSKQEKERFILNYDLRIIEKIASIDFMNNKNLFGIIEKLLNKRTKEKYLIVQKEIRDGLENFASAGY